MSIDKIIQEKYLPMNFISNSFLVSFELKIIMRIYRIRKHIFILTLNVFFMIVFHKA